MYGSPQHSRRDEIADLVVSTVRRFTGRDTAVVRVAADADALVVLIEGALALNEPSPAPSDVLDHVESFQGLFRGTIQEELCAALKGIVGHATSVSMTVGARGSDLCLEVRLADGPAAPPAAAADDRPDPVRVLVADDSAIYREGLVRAIRRSADLQLVGAVDDGRAAVTALSATTVDVVVLDYRMPDLDGLSAAMLIRERDPSCRILLLSAHGEEILERIAARDDRAGRSAADEIVSKSCSRRELVDRITDLGRRHVGA